jgi:hypothetical protein
MSEGTVKKPSVIKIDNPKALITALENIPFEENKKLLKQLVDLFKKSTALDTKLFTSENWAQITLIFRRLTVEDFLEFKFQIGFFYYSKTKKSRFIYELLKELPSPIQIIDEIAEINQESYLRLIEKNPDRSVIEISRELVLQQFENRDRKVVVKVLFELFLLVQKQVIPNPKSVLLNSLSDQQYELILKTMFDSLDKKKEKTLLKLLNSIHLFHSFEHHETEKRLQFLEQFKLRADAQINSLTEKNLRLDVMTTQLDSQLKQTKDENQILSTQIENEKQARKQEITMVTAMAENQRKSDIEQLTGKIKNYLSEIEECLANLKDQENKEVIAHYIQKINQTMLSTE